VGKLNSNTIGIYGALSYTVVAAACSSPQTTELNAKARSETLMKWVYLGLAQTALFTLIGMSVGDGDRLSPLIGAGIGSALLYASYVHARNAGLASNEPGTETY